MTILDFTNDAASSNNTRARTNAQSDRPKAKLWLNIGFEVNGKFVNLPVGIPLDTMEPVRATGQNADWVAFQNARNGLLKKLQGAGDALMPGAEMKVQGLEIRVRHINNDLVVATDENAYAADLDSMFTTTVIEAPEPAQAAE